MVEVGLTAEQEQREVQAGGFEVVVARGKRGQGKQWRWLQGQGRVTAREQ